MSEIKRADVEISLTIGGQKVPTPATLPELVPAVELVLVDVEAIEMDASLRVLLVADVKRVAETHARHTHDGRDHLLAGYEAAIELALALRTDCEERQLAGGSVVPKMYVSALQLAMTLRREISERAARS